MSYHNTNKVAGNYLRSCQLKADNQEKMIAELFISLPTALLTPFDVQKLMQERGYEWPITSVRRAMTDLSNGGWLVKSFVQMEGKYGKPNHAWRLNTTKKAPAAAKPNKQRISKQQQPTLHDLFKN